MEDKILGYNSPSLPTSQAVETTLDDILIGLQSGVGTNILAPLVTHSTPADGTFAFTTNATITGTGFPFTIEDANCTINQISYKASGEDHYTHLLEGVDGVGFSSAANVVTVAGATPFAAGDKYIVYITEQKKSYDAPTNAKRIREINNDASLKVKIIDFIDVTNVAAATYRLIIDFAGSNFDNATINVICAGGVTVSLFGTNNDDADDSSDVGWVPLDSDIVDTTEGWAIQGQEPWDRLMIKYVTSDTSNALVVDYTLGG